MSDASLSARGGDIRRFGYIVPKPGGTMDVVVHAKIASPHVLLELQTLTKIVFELQPIMIAFEVVARNHSELVQWANGFATELDDLRTEQTVPLDRMLEGFVSASQKVLNFLSASSAFLSLTKSQLSVAHGKESSEAKNWNTLRNDLHAGSFAYRFLYELRNFAQHRALPISTLHVDGKRLAPDAPLSFSARLSLVRDALLADGYPWGKVKPDLAQQPSEFDLLPLAREYTTMLEMLCLRVFELESHRLSESVRYMEAVKRVTKVPPGAIPVVFVGESASPGVPPGQYEMIPAQQLQWLLRKYDELLRYRAKGRSPDCVSGKDRVDHQ